MNLLKEFLIKHKLLTIIIIAVILSIPYWQSVNYPFQYDDIPTIFESTGTSKITDIFKVRLSERPVRKISLIIDRQLFDDNVIFYRIENIIMFIMCLILTGMFIYLITDSFLFVIFSMTVFAFHPVHASTILIVTHRKEMFLYIFSLLTFISHIKKKYIIAIICFILAIMSKETAIMLPIILLVYDLIFKRKLNKKYYIVFGIIYLLGIVVLLFNSKTGFYLPNILNMDEFLKSNRLFKELQYYHIMLIQPYLFIMYIYKLIFPINLSVDYYVPISGGYYVLKIVMGLLSLFYVYLMYRFRKNKFILFSMVLFFLSYIPLSNLIPVLNLLSDRYLFFPSISLLILLYAILKKLGNNKWIWIIPIVYLVLLMIYIPAFKTEKSLWQYTITKNPRSIVGNNNLGLEYFKQGDVKQAYFYYREALKYNDEYVNAIINIGTLYAHNNDLIEAKKYFNQAIELEDYNIKALYNLGLILIRENDFFEARKVMEKIIGISPTSRLAHNNLGAIYFREGSTSELSAKINVTVFNFPMAAVFFNEAILSYFEADSIFRTGIAVSGESQLMLKNQNMIWEKIGKGK